MPPSAELSIAQEQSPLQDQLSLEASMISDWNNYLFEGEDIDDLLSQLQQGNEKMNTAASTAAATATQTQMTPMSTSFQAPVQVPVQLQPQYSAQNSSSVASSTAPYDTRLAQPTQGVILANPLAYSHHSAVVFDSQGILILLLATSCLVFMSSILATSFCRVF